jgi:hypothetical protein
VKIIPTAPEVVREAIIVLAGALLAYVVVKSLPKDLQAFFSLTGGNNQ